ncbi:MAG: hypothetical protein JSV79_10935 [Armatimonadota bacterium]|nr:MAG: hypothetical protein JSV79_10935 [Armatimonadota bacterium]
MGRFVQQDPIGSGTNCYTYVGNNPVVFIDPEGLLKLEDVGGWLARHDPVSWAIDKISDAIMDI